MAWENWSKKNAVQPAQGNDEPNATPIIDARGILGKEHHGFFATKFHNGIDRVFKNQTENVSGMLAAAAESRSHVFDEIENDLPEDSNLWDALGGKGGRAAAKVAMEDADKEVRQHVNSALWDASEAVHGLTEALPDDWESDVDESQIPYWMQIAGGVVENAPSLAANAAMFGLNPLAGTLFTMADIAGGTTKDLREKGVSAGDAWQAGALNAGAQMPLEMLGLKTLGNIFGGKPAQAIGALGKLPGLKNLKGKDPNSIRNAIAAAFVNEGIPEAAQEIPDEVISHIMEHGSMKGFDYGELASNMVDSALVGGVTGGILATPGAIANRVRNKGETAETVAENAHIPGTAELPQGENAPDNNVGSIDADATVTNADNTDRVGAFLAATGQQESSNNYDAYNADGDAHGKYQITIDTYRAEAPNAGVDPDAEMTPENQEKVARYMAEKYIRLYGEDGAIVAWYAGEGTAQAFVDGTLSEEAFTKKQGDKGQYPSIKEYLEQVKGRMANGGGAITTTPTKTAQASQPRSAADFLKDIEDTDTLEDEEASDRLHTTLTRGTKEEQEALAKEYGWNPEQEQQQAQQPTQQGKAPQQTQTTTTQVTQPTQRSAGTVEPISTNQNAGTVQQGNVANGAPTKQNTAPATKAVAPKANNAPQATDPTQTIVGNQNQQTPIVASPVESGKTPVYQPGQQNQAQANDNRLISKAKSNGRLKELARQAFVEGNADAKQILDNMHLNPNVLEAVKGEVIPNYVPQGVNAGVRDTNARRGVQSTPTMTVEPYDPAANAAPTNATGNAANNALPTSAANNALPVGNSNGNTRNASENTQNNDVNTGNAPVNTQNADSETTANGEKTTGEGKKTTEIKKGEQSKNTDKSNTEEQNYETTKEIRELLPETDKDKHGDTEPEKGGKSEGKDGTQTETENTVKDDTDKADAEEQAKGGKGESTKTTEESKDTSDHESFNSPMSENERQTYDKVDPDIKSNEWEDVTQTPEVLERARDEAKSDGGPRLSNESRITNRLEQCVITDDCLGGFTHAGPWISNVFKSAKLKTKNAVQNILTLARVLGGKQVTVDNEEAVHAWERVGFQVVARKDRGNGKYEYELVANTDSPTVAVEKIKNGKYKPSTKEELESVPTFPTDDIGSTTREWDYVKACVDGNTKKQAKILAEQKAMEKAAKDVDEIHNKAKDDMDKVIEGYKNGKGNKQVAEKAISAIAKKARGDIATADPKQFVPLARDRFNELVADKRTELKGAKRESPKNPSMADSEVKPWYGKKYFNTPKPTLEEQQAANDRVRNIANDATAEVADILDYMKSGKITAESALKKLNDLGIRAGEAFDAEPSRAASRAVHLAAWRKFEHAWNDARSEIIKATGQPPTKGTTSSESTNDGHGTSNDNELAELIAGAEVIDGESEVQTPRDEPDSPAPSGERNPGAGDTPGEAQHSEAAKYSKEIERFENEYGTVEQIIRAEKQGAITEERAEALLKEAWDIHKNIVLEDGPNWGKARDALLDFGQSINEYFEEKYPGKPAYGPLSDFEKQMYEELKRQRKRVADVMERFRKGELTALQAEREIRVIRWGARDKFRDFSKERKALRKQADYDTQQADPALATSGRFHSVWAQTYRHFADDDLEALELAQRANEESAANDGALSSPSEEPNGNKQTEKQNDKPSMGRDEALAEIKTTHEEASRKNDEIVKEMQEGRVISDDAYDAVIKNQQDALDAINGIIEAAGDNLSVDEVQDVIADVITQNNSVVKKINEYVKANPTAKDDELAGLDKESISLINKVRKEIKEMFNSGIHDSPIPGANLPLKARLQQYAEKAVRAARNKKTERIILRIANAYNYKVMMKSYQHVQLARSSEVGRTPIKKTAAEKSEIKAAEEVLGKDSKLYKDYYLPMVEYLLRFKEARETATESAFIYAKMAESFHANYGIWMPVQRLMKASQDPSLTRKGFRSQGGYYPGYNTFSLSLQYADNITLIHEAVHMYEAMLVSFSEMSDAEIEEHFSGDKKKALEAQKAIRKDLASIEDWAQYSEEHLTDYKGTNLEDEFRMHANNVKSGRDPAENRWRSERLARGAEKYFITGEAPTSVLKRFFERIKQVLVSYVNGKNLMKGELPPEVKAFYDKMVAGDPNFFKEAAKPKERKLKKDTARTDDGKKFDVTYEIVSADDLISSSDYDFAKNDKYPSNLQPRDRDREKLKVQVDRIARDLHVDELMESPKVNEGAPVINQDNVVENGNGRTMAITRAYKHGGTAYTESAKNYKKALVENAEKYGYTKEEVEAMENPVLVRRRGKDSDSMQESIINSTTGGMRMSAAQQAQVDAKKLSDNTMQLLKYDESDNIDFTKNAYANFVVSALNEIGGESEQDALFQKDGTPSAEGIRRVCAALAAKAYGDSAIIDRAFESTDTDCKNIVNALIAAAPKVSIVKSRLEEGTVDKAYNLPQILTEALGVYLKAKAEGKDIAFALSETSLFGGEGMEISNPQVKLLVRFFDANTRSQKKILQAISEMVDGVVANNTNMDSMFAGVVDPVTMEDIIRRAIGYNESPFEARKPGKDGRARIGIKKFAWKSMSKEHADKIEELAVANGGKLDRKTGTITFKDAESQANALAILEAYYAATSKETDMLKFSIKQTVGDTDVELKHKIKKATGSGYAIPLTTKAWNGSPADFSKFDLSFIGTGEGNQVHGWGIYFALGVPDRGVDDYGKVVSEGYKKRFGGENGHLYQAVIPGEDFLLDEQKPLNEQPKRVQEAVKKAIDSLSDGNFYFWDAEVKDKGVAEMRSDLRHSGLGVTLKKLIKNNDDLSQAFEAFIKRSPENIDAWRPSTAFLDRMYDNLFDKEQIDKRIANEAELDALDGVALTDIERFINRPDYVAPQATIQQRRDTVKKALFTAFNEGKSEAGYFASKKYKQNILESEFVWESADIDYEPWKIARAAADIYASQIGLSAQSDIAKCGDIALNYTMTSRGAAEKTQLKERLREAFNDAKEKVPFGPFAVQYAIDDTIEYIDRQMVARTAIKNRDVSFLNGASIQELLCNVIETLLGSRNDRSDKILALTLKAAGLKGYKYYGGRDGACAVVFDEAAMKIINKFSRKGHMETLRNSITKFCSASDLTTREKAIVAFAKKMGMTVQFFEGDVNLHGFHADGTNAVFLNRKSAMDLNKVFWHETFHWMRENNSALYNQLVKEVFGDKVSMQQLADYAASIGRTDMSMELCIEEMLADAMFDAGKRGAFFEKIGVEHPSLCAKLLKWISNMYKDFVAHFRNPEAGLTNTQVKRMAASLSEIAGRITDKNGNKLFEVDEKGNIKETAAGRKAISNEVKYMVTNRNVKPDTQVKITDVTNAAPTNPLDKAKAKALVKSLVGRVFKFNGGVGKVVIYDRKTEPGENFKAGNHLMRSASTSARQILNTTRQKALTMLADIFQNGIYIDKHDDSIHGKATKYIEIFAPVRDGNKVYAFQITARERGQAGTYEIGEAVYYNVKKTGKPLQVPTKGNKGNGSPVSTVSVADMLAGVNDRDGNPYVTANGTLNYDNAIFTQVSPNSVNLLSDSTTTDQSSSKLKTQLMSNFPNAQNIVEDENHIAFDLPNGTHVEANIVEDTIGVDWSKAQEDYGGTLTGKEKALGKLETVDRDAIITLTKDTVEEAPSHEAMHLAMGFLNERERDALIKKYGNEEAICEAMREWKIRRSEGKGTSMGKLMQKISDIAYKLLGLFHETDKNIFRKLESGELWEREADNKAAAKVSYMLDPSNAANDFLDAVANGDIKFSMDKKSQALDDAFEYLVKTGEVGDTIGHTANGVYRKNSHNTMKIELDEKPNIWKAFTAGKGNLANQAANMGQKIKAKAKPEVHAAEQNPHIRKAEKGKETGWGAIDWILNNTFKSPSRMATFAARRIWNVADAANRRMQRLYGDWTNSFARAVQKLNSEEKEKFNDILWAEDANQHVYTDAELKEMGCSDNVIRAHNRTRNLLRKIYNAVNDTYTRTKVQNHFYSSLKGAQKAQADFSKRPHTEVFKDIKEITRNGKTQYQVSIRTRGYREVVQDLTEGQIDDLRKDSDCFVVKSEPKVDSNGTQQFAETGEPLYEVKFLSYNKALTDMEGYMPHLFHGIMIIRTYKDKEGNSHSEVVGSAENMDKAVVLADKMQQEQGGEFLLAPKQFNSEGEVENPLFLGDKEYDTLMKNLRDGMTVSLEDARDISQARKKGRHISYSAIKKRKGAKGFETNAIWAIQHHIGASARYVALDPFKADAISFFERYFGDYDDDWAGKNREAAFIKGYIDSMLGKPSVLEKVANSFLRLFPMFKDEARPARLLASNLTALTGVLKLGASPAAGFVNMLQILNCVGYVGMRKTAVGIKRALHPTSTDVRILKAAGADEEVGLAFDGVGKVPLERTKYSRTAEVIENIREKLMLPFTTAERTIRRATILAAYYDYMEKNKDRVKDPADLRRLALAHANDINRKVNFDYSVTDAPRIFRAVQGTVIGDVALQFQKYGVKELEVISDFLPFFGKDTSTKQKIEFFMPYLLVSGLWNAFPFEDALLALLGMLFGIDDPEKEVKKAMIEWAGNDPTKKAIVDVSNYGVGSIIGMDISQRVGLKGVVPETSSITQGGPFGSTAVQLAKAIANSDVNGGLKAVSPFLGNMYGAYQGYNTDSKGRKTVDYDEWGRAMRALGFRTTKEAHATDAQSIVYNYKQSKKADREKAKEAYFDNPSDANYQKLRDLGYSKNEIKGFKNNKNTTRAERAENGLSKDDKKKLKPVFDYAN